MKKYFIFLIVGGVFSLSTCTKDVYTPNVCFNEDVLPIFVSNCTMSGCHNSIDQEGDYDLSNYDGIMKGISPKHPLSSELYLSIRGSNPSMPPAGKLGRLELSTIKMWIELGAPNSSNCRTCDTTTYSYSGRIAPTVQTWCTGCHNSNSAGGGFNFSTYNGLVSSIANNKLMGSLNHLSGFSQMPKNAGQLSQCEIDAIQKWVDAGYPNN
jgi:hypothetical protein